MITRKERTKKNGPREHWNAIHTIGKEEEDRGGYFVIYNT